MIQFMCDTCSAIKKPSEAWLVGQAAEAAGAVSARREVTIQTVWDRTTTLHPLAVHFCSVQCKDEYMDRLFAVQPHVHDEVLAYSTRSEVVIEKVVPEKRRLTTKTRKVFRNRSVA